MDDEDGENVEINRNPAWVALGEAVVQRRVELGMRTRRELIEKSGISRKTLGQIERGDRESYDRGTLAHLEQVLRWPAGMAQRVIDAAGLFPVQAPQTPPGLEPSFTLEPAAASEVQVTDQALRLSWLTGPGSILGDEGAARLAAAVEAVMALTLPPTVPDRPKRAEQPRQEAHTNG